MMTEPPLVAVRLKNKYGTFLAASEDKTSLAAVCATFTGVALNHPKNTEWRIKMHSITPQFTEFSLRSIHNTELAVQSRGFESNVVCQQNPNPSQPFLWRIDNSQPCIGGYYLYCRGGLYKLCAAQNGPVTVKPGICDTQLDPGSWWFIEFVATSASEVASTNAALQQQKQNLLQQGKAISPYPAGSTCTHSAASAAPAPPSSQIISGMNHNGSGIQNVGNTTINSNVSGPELTNSASGIHNRQPPYPPTQWPPAFSPPVHGQSSNGPYTAPFAPQQQGAFFPQNPYQSSSSGSSTLPTMGWPQQGPSVSPYQYPGFGALPTMEQYPNNSAFSGAATPFGTYINTGNNTNGSGTQTNAGNISIKNKGPIYKYW